MLTIKAPIELKNRSGFVHDNEGFCHMITGRYSLMGSNIDGEDLLHAVTTPPEIFIAEGNQTTVTGNTFFNNRNEEKLEIINNVLNRILVSADMELAYQDRAYITDVLYKMGIRDDRRFMSEVRQFMEETKQENNLINLYLSGGMEALKETIREAAGEIRTVREERGAEPDRYYENHLSYDIMHRLQTGAVYQIVSNFARSVNNNNISELEAVLSEQDKTAERMLVQRIAENIRSEAYELIYRTEEGGSETYEGDILQNIDVYRNVNITEQDMRRFDSAEGYDRGPQRIRDLAGDENDTGQRAADIIYREGDSYREDTYEDNVTVNTGNERILNSINLDARRYETGAEPSGRGDRILTDRILLSITRPEVKFTYRSENRYEDEFITNEQNETGIRNDITQAVLYDIVKNLYNTGYERINENTGHWYDLRKVISKNSENTLTRLHQMTNDIYVSYVEEAPEENPAETVYNDTESRLIEETETATDNVELIREQIRRTDENNLKNVERYRQIMEVINKVRETEVRTDGARRTRQASLEALRDSKAVERLLGAEERSDENARRKALDEIMTYLPESSASILSILEQHLDGDTVDMGDTNIISNDITYLVRDIEQNFEGERTRELVLREREAEESAASEEIEKIRARQEANENVPAQGRAEEASPELVHKVSEALSYEELQETLEQVRQQRENHVNENEIVTEETENRTNVIHTVTENRSYITNEDREDIAEMVHRGVRQQMGAISEEVLHKLEKRLKNEKNRRGI